MALTTDESLSSFSWHIQNIPLYNNDQNQDYGEFERLSPSFVDAEDSQVTWQLKLTVGKKYEGVEYVSMYLCMKGKSSVMPKFSVCLESSEGNIMKAFYSTYHLPVISIEKTQWGWDKLLKLSNLFDVNEKLVNNQELRFVCNIWKKTGTTNDEKQSEKKGIISDIMTMFSASKCTDVEICVGDTKFKAHKSFLSCRSPVFAAMFQIEMSESIENVVRIVDFENETVKQMLDYIYSDELALDVNDIPLELVKIGDKYAVNGLIMACASKCVDNLNENTALDCLVLAELYDLQTLKDAAINFINNRMMTNYFDMTKKCFKNGTADFKNFMDSHPKLVAELYAALFKRKQLRVTQW